MSDPERIGKYEVLDRIGAGGCGVVYRARDPLIGRDVAIKLCITDDDSLRRRFFREANFIGNLSHPRIISIFDLGFEEGTPFLVEEMLSGRDLGDVLRSGDELALETKVEILRQVAEGLDFAHRAGVLHRDIKPSNIQVLDDGSVKLMDFGIARMLDREGTRLTKKGALVGTIGYMAPEQIEGKDPDGRVDIFSFGALAYQLLTGKRPFPADDVARMIRAVLHEEPTPLRKLWPECPPALADLVTRCLLKDRDERYSSFEEVLDQLDALQRNLARQAERRAAAEAGAPQGPANAGRPAVAARKKRRAGPPATPAADAEAAEGPLLGPPPGGPEIFDFDLRGAHEAADAAPPAGERPAPAGAAQASFDRRWVLVAVLAVLLLPTIWWLVTLLRGGSGPLGGGPPMRRHTLQVSSEPAGAAVWVDGADSGQTTPAELQLEGPEGQIYHLELRQGDLVGEEREIVLGAEPPAPWAAQLGPQLESFRITSEPPGARILLDGEPLDEVTPASVELDPAGEHDIVLELEGYEPARLVFGPDAPSEEQLAQLELSFRLERRIPPGRLAIETPYPLRATIDGQRYDVRERREIELAPGSYRVRIDAPAVFFSDTRRVKIESGERVSLRPPRAVSVRVMANPSNCRLRIDGRDVDWLPADVRLTVGPHDFEFRWESLGKSRRMREEIRADTSRVFATPDDSG